MRARLPAALAALAASSMLHATASLFSSAAAQEPPPVARSDLLPPPPSVPLEALGPGVDSVIAAPGDFYSAGRIHRFIFGDLNRNVWRIPFRVAVLRLDTLGGGATVTEVSGGKQTLGLRLIGENGVEYQFRSMVKTPRRAMPKLLRWTPAAAALSDQMAAQFPLGPLVVSELIEAVDVLVAKPVPVVMSDDPRLGEYRGAFAGRMGWIEVRPEERDDDRPGFAGSSKVTGTTELYEELVDNPRSHVNVRAVLRARLVDLLVGDWDRHSDQWRWARFKDGDGFRWDPIPRDRDWVLPAIDGLVAKLIRVYAPPFVGFSSEYPDILHLAWASQRVDRTLLSSLDRDAFMNVAEGVASKLTDDVLERAIGVLPPEFREAGTPILASLRARRDNLLKAAGDLYTLLAREPVIRGTNLSDSVTITTDGARVRVQLHGPGPDAIQLYDRTFLPHETREVRLFLLDGSDRVRIEGSADLPLAVRIATGGDDDVVTDATAGRNVFVYNSRGADEVRLGDAAFYTESDYLTQDSIRTAKLILHQPDRGSAGYVVPTATIESEIGLLLGLELLRHGYGFGQQKCQSCASLEWLGALRSGEWIADLDVERMMTAGGWWYTGSAELHSGRPTRFYGVGNDLLLARDEAPFTAFRRTLDMTSGVRYKPAHEWHAGAGLLLRSWGHTQGGGSIFDSDLYGAGRFKQFALVSDADLDTRDSRSRPTSGAVVRVNAAFYPAWLDVRSPYGRTRAVVRFYRGLSLPADPALHLRVVGEKVWGTAPFMDKAVLGGSSTLPGFARSQFRGDAMAAGNALLRLKAVSISSLEFGVHGVAGAGRVWESGESSSTWHRSAGAGAWLHVPAIDKGVSITFARGDGWRTYVDFGWIY